MQDAALQEIRQTDVMDPARAQALQIALERRADITTGSPLPPFFHQIYFWDARPADQLGRDGHPKIGQGFIPDLGLPRRMWAGGSLEFHQPLLAGVPAEKHSVVEKVSRKDGRTGPLGFVTIKHDVVQEGRICVTERQDLVYREDPDVNAPKPVPPVARQDEDLRETASFTPTLLFRYSALTFNGHRIHYDLDYTRQVEGYEGLVVHGPLLAQRLMLLAETRGPVRRFQFRASSPLMHFETADFCMSGTDMWVRGPGGRQCMQATVAY